MSLLCLIVAGPVRSAAGAPVPCRGTAFDVIRIRTMTVAIKAKAKTFPVGGVAKLAVHVTRPGDQDPLQLGVPLDSPASAPAADVTVGVGLQIARVFAPGYAKTDQNGNAVVSVRIPSYAPAASVDVDAYSYNVLLEAPCYTIQEDGYTHKAGVFKTTK